MSPRLKSKSASSFIIVLFLAFSVPLASAANAQQYYYRSTYTYVNSGDEPYFLTEDDVSIILFPENRWQKVSIRNESHAIKEMYLDEDGNLIGVLDAPLVLPIDSTLAFSVEYDISSQVKPKPDVDPAEAGNFSDIPPVLVEIFCVDSDTFTLDEEIESLARELSRDRETVLEVLTRFIDWILDNVTYGNFEVPKYPLETLDERRGDCDDQSILLISMLRSVGIPAYLQLGVVFSDSIGSEKTSWGGHLTAKQEGIAWHGWSMVYVPPWGWIPVDLTLTGVSDPMNLILTAPEYGSYVVTALNVTKQPYISDSRKAREALMSSEVYVTVEEKVLQRADQWWTRYLYVGVGLLAGGVAVAFIIFYNRNRE